MKTDDRNGRDKRGGMGVGIPGGDAVENLKKGAAEGWSELPQRSSSPDAQVKCKTAALRLLGYRPRSEAELRKRLSQKFESETVEQVMAKLRETRIIDDDTFARFWREQRESLSPRSKRLIRAELWQKGVDAELTADITKDINDDENAYRAAYKKACLLKPAGCDVFSRRLSAFLNRRGFNYDTIKYVVNRLWQDIE